MLRHGLLVARGLGHIISHKFSNGVRGSAIQQLVSKWTLWQPRSQLQNVRPLTMRSWPFGSKPRDYSQPNASWSAEMQRLYEHYNGLCEVQPEGGKKGVWKKLPSYNRTLKYATGGQCLSKIMQAKARLFIRNIEEQGAGFEYVIFLNKQEKTSVCVFQPGHLLEGPPGHVHGGAMATIIDDCTSMLAASLSGPVMTANLNINFRSPVPLGSVVLVHTSLERSEGRKIFITCRVTSTDGAKLHTEATGLFLSINVGHLFGA